MSYLTQSDSSQIKFVSKKQIRLAARFRFSFILYVTNYKVAQRNGQAHILHSSSCFALHNEQ